MGERRAGRRKSHDEHCFRHAREVGKRGTNIREKEREK